MRYKTPAVACLPLKPGKACSEPRRLLAPRMLRLLAHNAINRADKQTLWFVEMSFTLTTACSINAVN
jgi:hypothetical protein